MNSLFICGGARGAITWPLTGLGSPFVVFAALLLSCYPCRAQPHPQEQPKKDANTVYVPAKGMEGFRYILKRRGLEPLESMAEVDITVSSSNVVIILIGSKSITKNLDAVVNAYHQGAAVLIATNTASELNGFNVKVDGDRVRSEGKDCYRGLQATPFVRRFPQTHSVFDGFDEYGRDAIATSEASFLNFIRTNTNEEQPLAYYPDNSRAFAERSGKFLIPGVDNFAVGGERGFGKSLILADPTVFNNRMILAPDNGNKEFIHSCMDWLQGPARSVNKKSYCLFIENGEVKTNFDLPVTKDNFPWLNILMTAMTVMERHGDEIAAELEERDFFNKLVFSQFTLREMLRFGAIVLSILLLIVSFVRFVRGRATADPARTLITPDLAALIPRGSVLRQRFEGQLDAANLYASARDMARDLLGGLDAEPEFDGLPPVLVIEIGHPDAPELRQKIMRLWHIGFGTKPVKVSPREWRGLVKDLEKILEDADLGLWKFLRVNKA